jgi:hypothetical protein
MPKGKPRASRERTSSTIASDAGSLLNGKRTAAAVAWLKDIVDSPLVTEDARDQALHLLAVLGAARRVAGSALTQR